MEQPRQRHQESMIISGQSSKWRALVDIILTCFFWIYSLVIVIFFFSALFNFKNPITQMIHGAFQTDNSDIQFLLLVSLILFLTFSISLSVNRFYNIKRFGSLKRRTYPRPTSIEEMTNLNMADRATIQKLQENNYLVLEKNPIVPLHEQKQ